MSCVLHSTFRELIVVAQCFCQPAKGVGRCTDFHFMLRFAGVKLAALGCLSAEAHLMGVLVYSGGEFRLCCTIFHGQG